MTTRLCVLTVTATGAPVGGGNPGNGMGEAGIWDIGLTNCKVDYDKAEQRGCVFLGLGY